MSLRTDAHRPDVSIVIPVFNKLELTRICIDSIWEVGAEASFEILVVDNGSSDGSRQWLAGQERLGRLKLIVNPENLGFARGCNLGAEHARGRYILFLNNDMKVLPGWLDPLVCTLDRDPEVGIVGAKLLFPDNTIQHAGVALVEFPDQGDIIGGFHLAYRKPAGHPGTNHPISCQIVTGACLMIRPEIFQDIGGLDEGYWNGNEDVDLCLKAGQLGWRVVFRPESLIYHFESQSGAERWAKTNKNIERFNEAWKGVALPDFRLRPDKTLNVEKGHSLQRYTPPRLAWDSTREGDSPQPTVSIIVLTWNALEYTRQCAASLLEHTDTRHEIIFVDNGSRTDTIDYLRELDRKEERVRVIFNGRNLGFAAGNNIGMAAARGDYFCLLNSDTVVTAGWLEALLAPAIADDRVGLVGPVTNSISGGQKLETVPYDQDSLAGLAGFAAQRARRFAGQTRKALMVVGFCLLVRRALVERIGGLDEGFGQGNYEDTDYCLRSLLADFNTSVALDSFVHHFGSRSFVDGKVDYSAQIQEKFEVFRRKWNLEAKARSSASLNLEQLMLLGFIEPLHFCPLPALGNHREHPLGDWEEAIWLHKGEAFFTKGRLNEAERIFRAVLRQRPGSTRAANDLACTLWKKEGNENQEEAVAILLEVLQADPDNEDARFNLEEMSAVQG